MNACSRKQANGGYVFSSFPLSPLHKPMVWLESRQALLWICFLFAFNASVMLDVSCHLCKKRFEKFFSVIWLNRRRSKPDSFVSGSVYLTAWNITKVIVTFKNMSTLKTKEYLHLRRRRSFRPLDAREVLFCSMTKQKKRFKGAVHSFSNMGYSKARLCTS